MIEERFVITWVTKPTLYGRLVRKEKLRCGVLRDSFPSLDTAIIFMAEFYKVKPTKWVLDQQGTTLSTKHDLRPIGGSKVITFNIAPLITSSEALDEPSTNLLG